MLVYVYIARCFKLILRKYVIVDYRYHVTILVISTIENFTRLTCNIIGKNIILLKTMIYGLYYNLCIKEIISILNYG